MLKQVRFKIIPAVFLILVKDGKILLAKRQNTGYEDGNWDTATSGHIEKNESLAKAMKREAKEEIGIDISIEDLELVHVLNRVSNDGERIDFFFSVKKWQGEPKIMEKDKCSELKWFDLSDLPENTIKPVRQAIENILNNKSYSEFNI